MTTSSFEDRVVRGVPWAALSFGANKVITVATTFVLARLLSPSDFGVVALAVLSIGVLSVFGNLGLSGALVLRLDLDERGKGTVLSLMLATSAVIAAVVTLGAPLAAAVFHETRLRGVLSVLALSVLPSGLTWFYEAVMQRELEFRSRFVAQTVQSGGLALVSIGAALAGFGVWSLVAGQVVSVVLYAGALLVVSPHRVRPAFDRGAARDIAVTGRGFLAQGALAFLKQNTDYVAVGRVLGTGPLGFYSVAYRMGELPYWSIVDPVAKVTFPGFARMRARGDDVTQPFLSVLQSVALVACPLGVILSGAADPFTRALFGERWLPMITPLTVLGIWGAIRPVHATIGWLFNSVGMAGLLAKVSAATLCVLIPGLILSAALSGITAVACMLLIEMTVAGAALSVLAGRRLGIGVGDQWKVLRPVVAGSVIAWVVSRLVAVWSTGLPDLLRLGAAAGLGAGAYLLAVLALDRGVLSRSLRQTRRMVGRAPGLAANGAGPERPLGAEGAGPERPLGAEGAGPERPLGAGGPGPDVAAAVLEP